MSFARNVAMTRQRQQYRTSDYKCTFIDFKRAPDAPVRAADRNQSSNRADASISRRLSMLRQAIVVLAIALVLGNFGLSTSALARGGGHGGSGSGDSFLGNHPPGGFGGVLSDSFGGTGNRTGG